MRRRFLTLSVVLVFFLITGPASAETSDSNPQTSNEPPVNKQGENGADVYVQGEGNDSKAVNVIPGTGSVGKATSLETTNNGLVCVSKPYTDNDLLTPIYDFDSTEKEYAQNRGIAYSPKTMKSRKANATAYQEAVSNGSTLKVATKRLYSPTGKWVSLYCSQDDNQLAVTFNDLAPVGGPSVTLGQLLNEAIQELDPPVHNFSLNPASKQLVQFPTLFWINQDYWNTERTTTKSNGNVSVTLTLTPFETEWNPGDGSDPVICNGPGQVWEYGLKGETFYCKHTYRTVEGQPFTLTSTVRFRLDTETNSTETLGPFPSIERTDSIETGAREIQVVETND